MAGTVIVLGAGATKSCAGPLTDEILREVFVNRADFPNQERLDELEKFLAEHFHVLPGAPKEDYPGLPLLMSLIDTAIDRRQAFHPAWNLDRVTGLRHAMELAIFDLLEWRLKKAQTNNHFTLLSSLYPHPLEPRVISLNYDLVADAAVMFYGESRVDADPQGNLPDYGCDISTDFYRNNPKRFGTLLKLHGSLNWLYCRTCQRLEIGASESRRYLRALGNLLGTSGKNLDNFYRGADSKCATCDTELRALLIPPSHLKDYRNPHLADVWYRAERLLRDSDRAVFVGYSLPDDVEVVYLLKRGLAHLPPDRVIVVEYDSADPETPIRSHPAGRRYRSLFGDGIRWSARGLDDWLAKGMV